MNQRLYTHIAFLLDRSGSMEDIRRDVIEGFNRLLREQAAQPGPCTFTLVQFDTDDPHEVVWDMVPIDQVPALTETMFKPRGGTPLIDAMGDLIVHTSEKLRQMPTNERPDKVMVVILTDGLENSSHRYTQQQVFDMITQQRQVHQWEFLFLGADQDAIAEGGRYGISAGNSYRFSSDSRGSRAVFRLTSDELRRFRRSGSRPGNPSE